MEILYTVGISFFIAVSFGIVGLKIKRQQNAQLHRYGISATYKYLADMQDKSYDDLLYEKYWEESKLNII